MSLANKVAQFNADADKVNQITHGDDSTVVQTASGPVRSLAKLVKDNDAAINATGLLGDVNTLKVLADVARGGAEAAKVASELARDAALIQSGVFANEPTGRAAVADGVAFKVQGSGDVAAYEYRRTNSAASVLIATYPASVAVDDLRYQSATINATGRRFSLVDADGFEIVAVKDDGGFVTETVSLLPDRVENTAFSMESAITTGITLIDSEGFYIEIIGPDGSTRLPLATPDANISDSALYGARNSQNLASSIGAKTALNSVVCALSWDYNHIVSWGQSLSNGWESWPPLSKTVQYPSNVMVGASVRPSSESGIPFAPAGGSSAFSPLISVAQNSSGFILTDAQVAALAEGDGARGETLVEGALNFAKRLHNLRKGMLDDAGCVLIGSAPGTGGRTIEELSKGATPNLWSRLTGVLQAAKNNTVTASKTYGIAALLWVQGEWNYNAATAGDKTKSGYKALLSQLWSDFKTDCVQGIAGQALPPALIMYQTGASYTSDTNELAIGMGQWEFCNENLGCYMATPVYPYTDKGGHLDPNGARWFGNQVGKVIHRVVELRQDWKPLSPRSLHREGRVISIDFHVPEPPIVFDLPYVMNTGTNYSDQGFTVLDDAGVVGIDRIRIVMQTIVEISCSRDLIGFVHVRYADKTYHNGNGCLRDSDATVANDHYEYTAGNGQYSTANIPALVGKPYPLWNWCIAFSLSVN